jgi:hypothetical protein
MHNDYIELTKNIFALYQKLTRKHGAMTVNERLWLSGYYDEYEVSIKEQNISKFIIFDLFTLPSITNLPELLEPLSLLDGNPTLSRKFLVLLK